MVFAFLEIIKKSIIESVVFSFSSLFQLFINTVMGSDTLHIENFLNSLLRHGLRTEPKMEQLKKCKANQRSVN